MAARNHCGLWLFGLGRRGWQTTLVLVSLAPGVVVPKEQCLPVGRTSAESQAQPRHWVARGLRSGDRADKFHCPVIEPQLQNLILDNASKMTGPSFGVVIASRNV